MFVLINVVYRAAYWRWAGFLTLNFNRRTEVKFCIPLWAGPFSPPIANTMLCLRPFSIVLCCVILFQILSGI